MYDPVSMSKVPMIKVSDKKLRNILSKTNANSKYIRVAFNDFFDANGDYIIAKDVELAYEKLPKDRGQFDKDLIKVDERVNICFAIYGGAIFRFFPFTK